MTAHLPALVVLIPFLAAPLCALLRHRLVAWLLFLGAAAGSLACAVLLATRVTASGPLHYAMGGWQPPVGIEYVIDAANVPVLLLLSTVALAVGCYAKRSVENDIEPGRIPLFYTCSCLTLTGMLGVAATGDAFNAFVFFEIASLSSYALIAMGKRRRALLAAFRYLIIGTIGATFLLIGIGLAYAVTGTLNMADLAQRLPDVYGNNALTAAVAFTFVGLAVKMAVFPLHAWLPDAYAEAPSAVSALVSGTGTKVAIYAFMRFAFTIFGAGLVFGILPVDVVGLVTGCVAMVVGSAVACVQRDLKYLLAWSSVGQIGYIVVGFSLHTADGVSAAYLHLVNHGVIKAGLFAAAGILLLRLGTTSLSGLSGLGRRMPWTFGAIVAAGLGLVGVPPTAGFVSKWALAEALIDEGRWLVLVTMLASSLVALGYVGRIVEAAWFRQPRDDAPVPRPPASMVAATWFLVLLSLYLGVDPSVLGGLADGAAATLLGGDR